MSRTLYTPSKSADVFRIVTSTLEEFEKYEFTIVQAQGISPTASNPKDQNADKFPDLAYEELEFTELRVFENKQLVLRVQIQDTFEHVQGDFPIIAIFLHQKREPTDLFKPIYAELKHVLDRQVDAYEQNF
jgi:hypothetical protein